MKKTSSIFLITTLFIIYSQCVVAENYHSVRKKTLLKEGKNSIELKKVMDYYKNDPQKYKAACFLIENMDCHSSQSYYWTDENNQKLEFQETAFPTYEEALKAFNEINSARKLTPVKYTETDLNSIKADYLIKNIDDAFAVWKSRWSANLSFEMFCEYILPYRIMNEPFGEWRESYRNTFGEKMDACKDMRVKEACTYLCESHKNWFSNIFDYQVKKEPQDVLSPEQILFRRQGYCEDIVNWGVYMLRSMGIASCVDYTPYWATTAGGHFWQVAFNERGEEIPFFMGDDTPAEFFMRREPSKVLRITYSKQQEVPAAYETIDKIPDGFLRRYNFIDVTDQYWRTASVSAVLGSEYANEKLSYLAVLNGAKWRIAWWSKTDGGKATFDKMSCGVVYLPMVYKDGKEIPAADPYLLTPQGTTKRLKADKTNPQTIHIEQKAGYLQFRPKAKYNLMYWDSRGQWVSLGIQTAPEIIRQDTRLHFEDVPDNALFVLIPEYSQGKERPFTFDRQGKMNWW